MFTLEEKEHLCDLLRKELGILNKELTSRPERLWLEGHTLWVENIIKKICK